MSFEKLWKEIAKTKRLPGMALIDMPNTLSQETKKMLMKSRKSTDELIEIFIKVIDTINQGSVEKVDPLVQKYLSSGDN